MYRATAIGERAAAEPTEALRLTCRSRAGCASFRPNPTGGDAGTGRTDTAVSNRRPKGTTTADAITVNQVQLELFDLADVVHLLAEDGPLTWLLLLHRGPTEIRAELSLPSEIAADGHVTRWQERILCPPCRWTTPPSRSPRRTCRISIST